MKHVDILHHRVSTLQSEANEKTNNKTKEKKEEKEKIVLYVYIRYICPDTEKKKRN